MSRSWLLPAAISAASLADVAFAMLPSLVSSPPPVREEQAFRALSPDEQARLRKVREALRPGLAVADLTLVGVVDERVDRPFVFDLAGRGHSFRITVAPVGALPFHAPIATRLHAIFYQGGPAESAEAVRLRQAALSALAERIRAVE